jgi:hypothetical protein
LILLKRKLLQHVQFVSQSRKPSDLPSSATPVATFYGFSETLEWPVSRCWYVSVVCSWCSVVSESRLLVLCPIVCVRWWTQFASEVTQTLLRRFCNGNARAALQSYGRRFLPSSASQSGRHSAAYISCLLSKPRLAQDEEISVGLSNTVGFWNVFFFVIRPNLYEAG